MQKKKCFLLTKIWILDQLQFKFLLETVLAKDWNFRTILVKQKMWDKLKYSKCWPKKHFFVKNRKFSPKLEIWSIFFPFQFFLEFSVRLKFLPKFQSFVKIFDQNSVFLHQIQHMFYYQSFVVQNPKIFDFRKVRFLL